MFECSEEMYEAFKKALIEASDSETQRDVYMNAIEAAVVASKTAVPPAGDLLESLTAERDALKAEVATARKQAYDAGFDTGFANGKEQGTRDAESELTKARKLLEAVTETEALMIEDSDCQELELAIRDYLKTRATPAAKVRQYYYRTNNCNAPDSKDPACDCWHDEGTGPLGDEEHNRKWGISPSSWRDKPVPKPCQQPQAHPARCGCEQVKP